MEFSSAQKAWPRAQVTGNQSFLCDVARAIAPAMHPFFAHLELNLDVNGEQVARNAYETAVSSMGVSIEFRPLSVESLDELSIQQVLELCLSEESTETAWCEFVRRTQRTIAGGIYRHLCVRGATPTIDIVDDLVQWVYAKLFNHNWKSLRRFKPQHPNALFGYLKTVARTVTEDYLRKRKRLREEPLDDLVDPPNPGPRPERNVLMQEVVDHVKKEFPEQEFQVFLLHYKLGFTAKAISELPWIDLSEKQVEYVLWRIICLLKNRFGGGSE